MEGDSELVPEILPVDSRLVAVGSASAFLDIISRALRVVPDKEVVSGTSYVKLDAREARSGTADFVRATATDGTLIVSAVEGDVSVRHQGSILIPGQKICSILKTVPEDRILFQVSGTEAIIRSGRSQWKVQLPPGDSLPAAPDVSKLEAVPVPRVEFLASLKAAEASASKTAARSSLMQVKVEQGHITGTDGNRIHRSYYDQDSPLDFSIPLATCQEVMRLLAASEDSHLLVGTDGKTMVFSIDKDYVISSHMLVDFPDIEPLLIRSSMNIKHTLSVDSEALRKAAERVRVNSDPEFSSVFLMVTKDNEGTWGAALRSKDRQGNSAHEFFPANWDGPQEPREFCVNHKHLISLLDSYPKTRVNFHVGDDTRSSKSPLVIEDDSIFVGLVQQMRADYMD